MHISIFPGRLLFLSSILELIKKFLSLDKGDLPPVAVKEGKTTYRSVLINGEEFEFSQGFTDLHTLVYQQILAGKGFGIEDARASVNLAYTIRNTKPTGIRSGKAHAFLKRLT